MMAEARPVRTPLTPLRRSGRRRSLDERLAVRFPALVRLIAVAVFRLPPGSRLRRALLSRRARQGYAASSRRDFDFALTVYDPDVEVRFVDSGGVIPPDLVGVQRGHEGFRRIWGQAIEAMEDLRMEPEELIDAGDRLLLTGYWRGHGTGSGLPVEQRFFEVFALRRGMIVRHEIFFDRAEALDAAGLSE